MQDNIEAKLTITPAEVLVHRDTHMGSVRIKNGTHVDYAFKIKTTHPNTYKVHPNTGVILSGKEAEIMVEVLDSSEDLAQHKFLFQFVAGTKDLLEGNLKKLFSMEEIQRIEKKIHIRYMDTGGQPALAKKKEGSLGVFIAVLIIAYYIMLLIKKMVFGR